MTDRRQGMRDGFTQTLRALPVMLQQVIGHALSRFWPNTWQAAQREGLARSSARLAQLLLEAGLGESSGTPLFRYLRIPHAEDIFTELAGCGILVRRFTEPPALRFGLPGAEDEWQRIADALAALPGNLRT